MGAEHGAVTGPVERGVGRQRATFETRRAAWCDSMGLRQSNARPTAVLRWLDGYSFPPGFDHTGVYYSPRGRFHLLLTEPYHSTEKALLSIQSTAEARNGEYGFAVGGAGTGLWYPGSCAPLLIAAKWAEWRLEEFAAGLPTADELPPNVRAKRATTA